MQGRPSAAIRVCGSWAQTLDNAEARSERFSEIRNPKSKFDLTPTLLSTAADCDALFSSALRCRELFWGVPKAVASVAARFPQE